MVRGQKWPSGSMGRPQRGQSGRPAATTCRACSLRERICAACGVKAGFRVAGIFFFSLGDGLCDQDHEVLFFVVAQPELSDAEGRFERFAQVGYGGLFLGGGQVGAFLFQFFEELQDRGRQRGDLFLLHDEGGEVGALPRLQEEGALTGTADGIGDDCADRIKVEGEL